MSSKIFIILPAYNEEAALARLIPDIVQSLQSQDRPYEIILVDDGSRDNTAAMAASFPSSYNVRRLAHSENRGYGAALKTGFVWVVQHSDSRDVAISLDADRTHSPVYFPALLIKLEEGYDIVTASYVAPGGNVYGVPWKRRLLSAAANRLFRAAFPIPGTRAFTNGYRAYRLAVLQRAYEKYREHLIEEQGFPGGTELLLKVCALGARTSEIPFDLHYEYRQSQSKIHILPTVGRYLRLLGKSRTLLRR